MTGFIDFDDVNHDVYLDSIAGNTFFIDASGTDPKF